MKTRKKIEQVEKEEIKFLHFPKQEVLNNLSDQQNRKENLIRGLSLGNLEHLKVKIVFADDQGIKKVETTIWGITDKFVILKQSIVIPLERILSISY
ncbi:hypothetical protein [Aquimarina algicola]|uniref:Uncharacterized protein n=1 Tax=Aquimarina algicola TaxID=2589995 RepID=A0A504J6K7_9FLAO|nr:hypothetical protein [Aquimarina algicola]TPN86154.1 hypothetical protein FHK87_12850 [Aquimarina algicola]